MPTSISLIIPAAGSGSRFGSEHPKQFHHLCGISILRRSVEAFHDLVDEVIIIGEEAPCRQALSASPMAIHAIVPGGETRLHSVWNGIKASSGDILLIHDAARPLVNRACIKACIKTLHKAPAACVALPCPDTVKEANDQGHIATTLNRSRIHLAQTPQGCHRHLALAAYQRAIAEAWPCTDDAQVMERAGHPVALIPGSPSNRKITTRDDLHIAQALLQSTEHQTS